jgi:hypothetical protein
MAPTCCMLKSRVNPRSRLARCRSNLTPVRHSLRLSSRVDAFLFSDASRLAGRRDREKTESALRVLEERIGRLRAEDGDAVKQRSSRNTLMKVLFLSFLCCGRVLQWPRFADAARPRTADHRGSDSHQARSCARRAQVPNDSRHATVSDSLASLFFRRCVCVVFVLLSCKERACASAGLRRSSGHAHPCRGSVAAHAGVLGAGRRLASSRARRSS